MIVKNDLQNKRFDKLLVISTCGKSNKGYINWLCKCDCGNEKIVCSLYLKQGWTRSCGCIRDKDNLKKLEKARLKITKYSEEEATYRNLMSKYHDIDFEYDKFVQLISSNCYYCNSKPNNKTPISRGKTKARSEKEFILRNGLDRKDNSKGHSLDNVVPCCYMCNTGKLDRSEQEFRNYIKQAYEHCLKNNML